MRIKAVCEASGLTDRTVRYYIEEELISPVYTENYLGRKTFDFSESDIQKLNDIAVLRKFGFSIAEIKEMAIRKGLNTLIQVDGGVNLKNAVDLKAAGTDSIVVGSTITSSPNPLQTIADLKAI